MKHIAQIIDSLTELNAAAQQDDQPVHCTTCGHPTDWCTCGIPAESALCSLDKAEFLGR